VQNGVPLDELTGTRKRDEGREREKKSHPGRVWREFKVNQEQSMVTFKSQRKKSEGLSDAVVGTISEGNARDKLGGRGELARVRKWCNNHFEGIRWEARPRLMFGWAKTRESFFLRGHRKRKKRLVLVKRRLPNVHHIWRHPL